MARNDNGQPYSPLGAVLVMAAIFSVQVGAVVYTVERILNNERTRR